MGVVGIKLAATGSPFFPVKIVPTDDKLFPCYTLASGEEQLVAPKGPLWSRLENKFT